MFSVEENPEVGTSNPKGRRSVKKYYCVPLELCVFCWTSIRGEVKMRLYVLL